MAKVLPQKVRQEIDHAAQVDAQHGRWSRVGWVIRKINECAVRGADHSAYQADPVAAIKHVLGKHPQAVTPDFIKEVILPLNDVTLFKKAVEVVKGDAKVLSEDVGASLLQAALKHSTYTIDDGWMRTVDAASPKAVMFLLQQGVAPRVKAEVWYGHGREKETLSAIEFAVLNKTFTPELGKVLSKAKCTIGSTHRRSFLMRVIEKGIDATGVKALFELGYTFAPETFSKRVNQGWGYAQTRTFTWAPLVMAIQYGHREAAEAIIKIAKPDLTLKDEDASTALHEACKKNLPDIAALIAAKRGVDVNAKDELGRTPMMLAIDVASKPIVEMLAARSKTSLSGRVKTKRDDKEVTLTLAEYAKHCAVQADKRFRETPEYPDLGETAHNDEYLFTIQGGDTVPVAAVEREHEQYRERLKAFSRQAHEVASFVQQAASPKPKTAQLGV